LSEKVNYKARLDQAYNLSVFGTIVTVLLSLLSGLIYFFQTGRFGEYDPEIAVLAATLLAIIWYVYWTFRAVLEPVHVAEKQRDLFKTNLASALLEELQGLDNVIRTIYKEGEWSYDPLDHPYIEEAVANLNLFSTKTIHSLSRFYRRLRDLRNYHNVKLSFASEKKIPSKEEFHEPFLRAKANLTCMACNELAKNLKEEGGVMPSPIEGIEWKKDNVPPLPQSVFPPSIIKISNFKKTESQGNVQQKNPADAE
jgi:hypothetical protein